MQQYQQPYTPGGLYYQPYPSQQQQQQPQYVAPYLPQQPAGYWLQPTQPPFAQHAPAAAALPSQLVLPTPHPAAAPVAAVHPVQPHNLQQHYAPGQHQPQQQQHLGPHISHQYVPWSSQPRPMYRAQLQPHPGQYPVQQQQQQQQSMMYGHQLPHQQQQPAPSQHQQQASQGYVQPPAGQLRASTTSLNQYPAPRHQQLQPGPQPYGQGQQQPAVLQYQHLPRGTGKPPNQQQKPTSQQGQQPSQQQKQQQKIQLTSTQLRQREQQWKEGMMQQQREKQEQRQRNCERQQAEQQRKEQEQRAATATTAKQRQEERQQCMEQNLQRSRLLQLPEGILARIAARLTKQERVMLARLVLPQNSAVAAEVLCTILGLRFCRKDLRTSEESHNRKRRTNPQAPFHCTSGSAHVHYNKCPQPMRDAPSFVAALQNLRSLSLELDPSGRKKPGNPAFGPGLPGFSRLTDSSALTSLQLTVLATNKRESQVQEAALKIVAQLSSLRVLAFVAQGRRLDNMTALSPSANVFAALSGLTGLQCLELQYVRSSEDLGLSTLAGLIKLTELQLHEHRTMSFVVSQELANNISQLAPLLAAAQLQKVIFRGFTFRRGHYPLSVRPDNLRVLDISGCVGLELFPDLTPPLPQCTTLQELRAGSCRELYLAGSGAGRPAVEGNASAMAAALASSLTLLDISDAGLIPWGVEFVIQLTSLRSLNIAGTWLGRQVGVIAAAGIIVEENHGRLDNVGTLEVLAKQLTGLTNLTMGCLASAYVEKYIIPAAELLWLTRLIHLKCLTVHGSLFEGSGWQAKASKLATCLTECTVLKQLTLRGCGFDAGDNKQVSQVLQTAGVGAKGLNVALHLQPVKVRSMEAIFDGGDSNGDTDFDDDYDDSDGDFGFDAEDEWGEGFDPDTYQDDFGGFYRDGPFGEVYYAAER